MGNRTCTKCGAVLPTGLAKRQLDGSCPACVARMLGAALDENERVRPLAPGDRFQDYKILEVLGQGGMGIVYKAWQLSLNRVVALKVLSPQLFNSPEFAQRFAHEARVLASINHPSVVQVHAAGREGDQPFIVMEYVAGTSLEGRLVRKPPPDLAELLGMLFDVAVGLEAIHAAGLVHRDIKPGNVLLDKAGRAKISDFGLAIDPKDFTRLTQTGMFIGSPHYVSPEHIRLAEVDGRSDLYAVGVMLFQGITGDHPFEGTSPAEVLAKHVSDPPPLHKLAGKAPRRVIQICRRLLEKDPAKRTASAGELKAELDAARTESRYFRPGAFLPSLLARTTAWIRYTLAIPRGRLLAASAVVLLVLMGVGGFVFMSQKGRADLRTRGREYLADAERRYATGDLEGAKSGIEKSLAILPQDRDASFLQARIATRSVLEARGLAELTVHRFGVELLVPAYEGPELRKQREAAAKLLEAHRDRPLGRGLLALLAGEFSVALRELNGDSSEDARLGTAMALFHQRKFQDCRMLLRGEIRDGLALHLAIQSGLAVALDHIQRLEVDEAQEIYKTVDGLMGRATRRQSMHVSAGVVANWLSIVSATLGGPMLDICLQRLEGDDTQGAELCRARIKLARFMGTRQTPDPSAREDLVRAFSRAVEADPENPVPIFHRGAMWSWLGDQEKGAADFRAAFLLGPGMVEAVVRAELALVDRAGPTTDARERIEALEALARRFPDAARIHLALGSARVRYDETGKNAEAMNEAIRNLGESLRLRPGMAEAHGELAFAHLQLALRRSPDAPRHIDEAILNYSRRIELAPRLKGGYAGRAASYMARTEMPDLSAQDRIDAFRMAKADFDQALKTDPENAVLLRNRGIGRYKLAKLEQLVHKVDPEQEHRRAIEDLSQAIALKPTDWVAYRERASADIHLAYSLKNEGRKQLALLQEAVADTTRALEMGGPDPDCWTIRGLALIDLGRNEAGAGGKALLEKAIDDLTKAAEARPRDAATRLNRAKCLTQMERKAEAIEELERVVALDPSRRAEVDVWLKRNGKTP